MLKALRLALAAPALAFAFIGGGAPAAASPLPNFSAGLIDAAGTVDVGSGFTVQHTGKGIYVITYPNSTGFASYPIMTVTPFGYATAGTTAVISGETGANGGAVFYINLIEKVGKKPVLVDNAFTFTLIAS
jgi:hypothetical protein